MKIRLVSSALILTLFLPMVQAPLVMCAVDSGAIIDPIAVGSLEEQMRNDPGIMALILTLQNDPAMQSLLADPAVTEALKTGDLETLVNDPRFQKLLEDPTVKEIEKKLR